MANWHVFSDDHEVPGQLLVDLQNIIGADEILPFFEKHGMAQLDATKWYPMQSLLDIYNDMDESKIGVMFDFVSIGMESAARAFVPPEFAALPVVMLLLGVEEVFKLNNRGTDFGTVKCEKLSDTHVKVTMRNPTPDDIWYGIYYGYVRRFAPKGTSIVVRYDETEGPRRDNGGDVTVLDISWG